MSIMNLIAQSMKEVTPSDISKEVWKESSIEKKDGFPFGGSINSIVTSFIGGGDTAQRDLLAQYGRAVWIYIAVYAIANAVSTINYKVFRTKGDEKEEVTDPNHPLVKLLKTVNPWMTSYDLWYATSAYLELKAECYWLLLNSKGELTPTSVPDQIWLLNPDRISIVSGKDELIKGYLYEVDGKRTPFENHEVIYTKYFNPEHDVKGLSALQPLMDVVDNDVEAIKYNRNFFKNSAIPSGVLETEQRLDTIVFNRLKSSWNRMHKGTASAHKMAILESGLKWNDITISQKDSEFIEGRKMNREDILAAYGVPPVIAGLSTQYNTAKQQSENFWKNTIKPKVDTKILATLNSFLAPRFGDDLTIEADWEEIPAFQIDADALSKRLVTEISSGLTSQNEARQVQGKEEIGAEGDLLYMAANLVPVGATTPEGLLLLEESDDLTEPDELVEEEIIEEDQ